jgi:hypothetical protein
VEVEGQIAGALGRVPNLGIREVTANRSHDPLLVVVRNGEAEIDGSNATRCDGYLAMALTAGLAGVSKPCTIIVFCRATSRNAAFSLPELSATNFGIGLSP